MKLLKFQKIELKEMVEYYICPTLTLEFYNTVYGLRNYVYNEIMRVLKL
jgi:hypothetical protein